MNRILRAVAVGAAASLLVVGCSKDEPRPKMAPTPSAGPSASTSPSEEPLPSNTPEPLGPEETVRAWVGARNEAMKTGDISAVTLLSSPGCSSCFDLVTPISETYDNGGHYETGGWSMIRSKVDGQDRKMASVTTALRLGGGTTYESAGASPVTYPAERRIAVFELDKQSDTWVVSLIGFLR